MYYLIASKPDDYGACRTGIVKCSKSEVDEAYYKHCVKKGDEKILLNYLSDVNEEAEEEDMTLKEYISEYY